MADAIGATSGAAASPATGGSSAGSSGGLTALAERDTFLRLLVAQVQNQDPLNPQEPIEFVSQLAQFSQLETLLSMRTSLENIEGNLNAPEEPADIPGTEPGEGS
jgi:flagellar basal-body rod modification protein FlgD